MLSIFILVYLYICIFVYLYICIFVVYLYICIFLYLYISVFVYYSIYVLYMQHCIFCICSCICIRTCILLHIIVYAILHIYTALGLGLLCHICRYAACKRTYMCTHINHHGPQFAHRAQLAKNGTNIVHGDQNCASSASLNLFDK